MKRLQRKQEGGFPQEAPQQMIPQESGMQSAQGSQQGMPPQGGDPMQQLMQQVQQAMQQGMPPEQIVMQLLQSGIPEEVIVQVFQAMGMGEEEMMELFDAVEQMASQEAGQGMPPEAMEQGMPPQGMEAGMEEMPPEQMEQPMMARGGMIQPFSRDTLRRYLPKAQGGDEFTEEKSKTNPAMDYGKIARQMSGYQTSIMPGAMLPGMIAPFSNAPMTQDSSRNPESEERKTQGLSFDPFGTIVGASSLINNRFNRQRYLNFRDDMRSMGMADNLYSTSFNPLNSRGTTDVNTGLMEPDNYVSYLQSFQTGGEYEVDSDTLAALIAAGANVKML